MVKSYFPSQSLAAVLVEAEFSYYSERRKFSLTRQPDWRAEE